MMLPHATVLVTGFEPFAGDRINPSGAIARALDGETIRSHRVVGAVLPVAFAAVGPLLDALIDAHRPALVIALGQAGGRAEISMERIAINLIDARIPDNEGAQPIDARVDPTGPDACFSTLPVKAMCAHLLGQGIPAAVSLSAGSFVCNQVFYALSLRLARDGGVTRGGFIHVPYLPEQTASTAEPSMPLDLMIEGIRAAIACAIGYSIADSADARIVGGTID